MGGDEIEEMYQTRTVVYCLSADLVWRNKDLYQETHSLSADYINHFPITLVGIRNFH